MSARNHLFLVATILAIVAIAINAESLRIGRRQPGDRSVAYQRIDVRAQYNKVVNVTRAFKVLQPNQVINYINATDRGYAGQGGIAKITRGGLNQREVTIQLSSRFSKPLNFTIEVYAVPRK